MPNIAFARPDATRDEVLTAARAARVDEFAEATERGYDTLIGERGVRLSGGQRQRISIARSLLADPRILILDEATSSLDSKSEALIQEALGRLLEGRTTIVIAHRLSTTRRADQILVVDAGRIAERGTHASLCASGGLYAEMYRKQHQIEQNLLLAAGECSVLRPPDCRAGGGRRRDGRGPSRGSRRRPGLGGAAEGHRRLRAAQPDRRMRRARREGT